jgi:PAS domain S-box-containing protein
MQSEKKINFKEAKLNLLESFLNSSSDVYVLYDENLFLLDINKAGIKLTGKSKKNILGKHITKIFKNVEKTERYKAYKKVLKTGKNAVLEGSLGYKPSDSDFFSIHVFKVNKGIGIIARDISKNKKNEKQIINEKQKLELILNSTPGITYYSTIDEKGNKKVEFMSPKTKEVIGIEVNKYLKIAKTPSIKNFFHPDDFAEIINKNQQLIKTNKPVSMVYRFKKPGQKNYIWLEETVVPQKIGNKIAIFGVSRNVTQEILDKQLVKNNEEKYRNLFERNLAGVFRTNLKTGKILDCNDSFAKIFHFNSKKEIIGKNAAKLLYFTNAEREKYVNDLTKNKQLINYKIRHKTKYNKEVWILANVNIVEDKQNTNAQIIEGTLTDITKIVELERKAAKAIAVEETNKNLQKEISKRIITEKELIRQQQYTNSIINSSLDIICASDKNNKIIEFNKAAQTAFGYSEKEILGKSASILYINQAERNKVKDSLKSNKLFTGEVINKRKNGETFISFLSGSLLYNEKKEQIGAMGVSRDITELKEAEEQLKNSLERNKAIINALPDIIFRIDKQGVYLDVLTNNEELLAYPPSEFLGKNLNQFFPLCFVKKTKQCIKRALRNERDIIQEYSLSIPTKRNGFFEARYAKINENEVLIVVRDITETKQVAEELKKSLNEKEILLKEIHHRVKNNLQVISSILNLQSSFIKDNRTINILRESQNRIKSMAFIHESLYQNKDFSNVNFADYVSNLCNTLFYTYNTSDDFVKLKLEISPIKLSIDNAIPCGLIINELVSNALKYAFPNNKKGELTIRVYQQKNKLNVEVEDNGIGFPENLNFRNTDSLGLQLVITLVEQLNAQIELISKEGCKFAIKMNIESNIN